MATAAILPTDSRWASTAKTSLWTRHDVSIRAAHVYGTLESTEQVVISSGPDAFSLPIAESGEPNNENATLTFTGTGVTLYGGTFPLPAGNASAPGPEVSLLYSIDGGEAQVSPLHIVCCDSALLKVDGLAEGEEHKLTVWVDFIEPKLVTSGVWLYNATVEGAEETSSTTSLSQTSTPIATVPTATVPTSRTTGTTTSAGTGQTASPSDAATRRVGTGAAGLVTLLLLALGVAA